MKPNKSIPKDGYENLSKEELIKFLRDRDMSISNITEKLNNTNDKLRHKDKIIEKKEQEINKLRVENENYKTAFKNVVTGLGEYRREAQQLVIEKFQLSPDVCSYSAEQLDKFITLISLEYIDTHLKLLKYSPVIAQSQSESNAGARNKASNAAQDSTTTDDANATSADIDDELDSAEVEPQDEETVDEVTVPAPTLLKTADKSTSGPATQLDHEEVQALIKSKLKNQNLSQTTHALAVGAKTLKDLDAAEKAPEPDNPHAGELPEFLKPNKLALMKSLPPFKADGVLALAPGKKIEHYCPSCEQRRKFKVLGVKRTNQLLSSDGRNLNTTLAQVYKIACTECGCEDELNPVEFIQQQLIQNPVGQNAHPLHPWATTSVQGKSSTKLSEGVSDEGSDVVSDNPSSNNQSAENKENNQVSDTTNPAINTPADTSTESAVSHGAKDDDANEPHAIDLAQELADPGRLVKALAASQVPENATPDERKQACEELYQKSAENLLEIAFIEKSIASHDPKLSHQQAKQLKEEARRLKHSFNRMMAQAQMMEPNAVVKDCFADDFIVEIDGKYKIINPYSIDPNVYGYSALFLKCKVSAGLIVAMSGLLSEMALPKSRIFRFFKDIGLSFSKVQCINWMIGFARAFLHPIASKIKEDILRHSTAILMDETTLKITGMKEHQNADGSFTTPSGQVRRSQIWTLNSSWTSPVSACWCMLSPTRRHDVVTEILKDAPPTLKFLTTDGYRGYLTALKELKENYGIDIKHTPCLTHLRRPLHQLLRDSGLLEVYNSVFQAGGGFTDFADNLHKLDKAPKKGRHAKIKPLLPRERDLLMLYYLINSLYYVETRVMVRFAFGSRSEGFKEALKEARQKYSAVILDAIYDIIYMMILQYPELITISRRGDKITYKANKLLREAKVLLGFINAESELRTCIDAPDVELNQSICERALRPGVIASRSFYLLRSRDGGEAFADYLGVFNTCRANGVSYFDYSMWLIANVKYRMIERAVNGKADPTIFKLPQKVAVTKRDEDGNIIKELLDMYDENNKTAYDKVDMTGLAPYDYAKYLRQLAPERKKVRELIQA